MNLIRSRSWFLLLPGLLGGHGFIAHAQNPEPAGWYTGDMHVHRSCGGAPVSLTSIRDAMSNHDLAVVALLADMGNGEVQNPTTDLPKVNGQNDPISTAGRIVHWDTEWHWDATYTQFPHQALGGHIIALSLSSASQVWEEYTKPIFDWAHARGGIAGFAHMQFLSWGIPDTLNCCIPVEYPVEVALGSCDFISEDVAGGDSAMEAYYRLLNCGFRPGFAAGSDYPCNAQIGALLTYVQVSGGLTYDKWVDGIANRRTVVSRNGHNEFLDLKVNGTATPGDEISLSGSGSLPVTITWTAKQNLSGIIELVHNGVVVASQSASVASGSPATLSATVNFPKSGWLAARRMGNGEHQVHTAAVFIKVNNAPVRASVADANFYVQWMDALLQRTSPGGMWASYFPTKRTQAQARYQAAKTLYQQIASEAAAQPLTIITGILPNGVTNVAYSATLTASGGTTPYSWSLASGSLPPGLTLNSSSGTISGAPTATGTFNFTGRVTDASNPTQTATKALSISTGTFTGTPGTFGNTADGTLSDYIWDNGAWINAGRFQASSNTTVSTMHAKVAAISGKYKCAIYTDSGAQPSRLLRSTAEVSNPGTGWQVFPLTSSVVLTNGSYYWLAIWSDNANARVYYSSTAGTLRWSQNNYGAWPDPISTSGGGNLNYCIYATGTGATLTNITVTPANPTILAGATQQFTATGTYSDGSTQNITSQAAWISSNTVVATINASGLATAASSGTTTISAVLAGKTGSTLLTVQSAALTITTTSLAIGNVSVAYSATLTASGGTTPYRWSLASGALPPGLTLNTNSGAIAGTPTTAGTYSFTAQVSDNSNPIKTAIKPLSITIAQALSSIAVTPANPTILSGSTQQFTATGTYSDGSTQNVTSQATWTSSSTAVATINASGLATGASAGSTTISAVLAGKTGGTLLTVQPAPVAITTISLPNGTVGAAYSTTVTAGGGTLPYNWSTVSGSLPPGLTLNPASGAITGIPSAAGTFNFTIQVSDASNPIKTATKALSITTIALPSVVTIWPGTSVPGLVDAGPDSAVELGVKFRSDVAGTITGIRFYKASANTGTHVGNLWTSAGALLAAVTFTGETASGWQQMNFGTPVTIASNTVYVASYHANTGHYSQDLNYFSSAGRDNPPLHALADGVSGGNGVYAYGASSVFPNQTWSSANYWVDVVFQGGPPPTLTNIVVTPANPSILPGATQQFTASATYSDGSTLNITSQATWISSNTVVATINASGLATAASSGTTTISAVLAGKTGSTLLTVQSAALTITTTSLATGTVSVAYSATLTASGGTTPYRWSLASGSLPSGLTLNTNSGAIAGTPTTAGTFSFTAQVSDNSNPIKTATKPLSITTAPALSSIGVTPANPTILSGSTQQFTTTGTYSDGSTRNVTSQATWTSSSTAVATINASGLATGASAGITTISAVLAGKTGGTLLTVQPAPLAITTTSLPNGTVGVAYSATITCSGGTTPYRCSLASGSLPTGLTLNTNGAIAGTPTVTGASSFTAQVSDSSNPVQNATKPLSITITTLPTVPILVLTNGANPFSVYYSEILLTEGLNEFELRNISSASSATLAQYDVVILGQMALSAAQVTTLSNWVYAGGNLIAMRPDKQLAGLLGLTDAGSTLSEGYLLVNTASGPGVGIVGQTIQFHGIADRYTLGSASSLATLYSDAVTATANPGVTLRSVGANGGQAAAFTFDLARSVVLTRQGNPAWAGQDRDGVAPLRCDDLFFGASSNPQPNWVNLSKVAIPQADEQQRLLANMILSMDSDRKLLPRFWYFPHGHKAAVVMTGDDHALGATAGRFDQYMAASPPGGSVDDWQTIRSTSYVYPYSGLTDAAAAAYNAAGFELGVHLTTGCANYTAASLNTFFSQQLNQWRANYPSLPNQATHRMHCIAWSGYTILPEVGALHGIRLDTSYYWYPSSWVANRPGLFTGSGMPMRFATTNGNLIDVFQAATQMTDESHQSYPYTADVLLDRALGPEGYYGAFVANMHTDFNPWPQSDVIIMSATNRGVPVISARQLLTWLDGRNASSIKSINWINNTETFSVQANASARGLQAMVPVPGGYSVSNLKYNGSSVGYYLRTVKGIQYAFFPALSGSYEVSYVLDTAPPGVTGILPPAGQTGVSPRSEVNITFSEAMNASTINSNTVVLLDSVGNSVAATVAYNPSTFTAVLKSKSLLRQSETHTAGAEGGLAGVKDIAGNALTSDYLWSFTTTNQFSYSIWDNTAVPAVPTENDTAAIEVGVKFQSALSGYVTGIRFYKGAANTGTHVGSLWTSTGTLLGRATFANETASGWQYQALATPVAITSNTTYVVSYHTTVGRYAANTWFFAVAGAASFPLRALADGENGGNGLYRYGGIAFPNLTYNAENYWVDVVFKATLP